MSRLARRPLFLVIAAVALASISLFAYALFAGESVAGRRYALVVGVQHYDGAGLGNLRYCDNDASGLAETLGKLGYRVTLLTR